jgi:shikimate kinase
MASKRDLKKSINNLTFELVSECFSYKSFHPKKKHTKTDTALENLIKTRNDLIQRVNHPVDKEDYKKNRAYLKEVIKDMNNMVSVMDNIG